MAGISDESSLEESDVDNRGVKVAELEDENFEREIVFEVRLSSMHFPLG